MQATMTSPTLGKATDIDMIRVNSTTAQRTNELTKGKLAARGANLAKIDETANEFEAQFISQMLENMFSTVDTKGFLGGGDAEETYRSMMIDQYGKMISKAGGIGVADHVKREMLRLQEVEA